MEDLDAINVRISGLRSPCFHPGELRIIREAWEVEDSTMLWGGTLVIAELLAGHEDFAEPLVDWFVDFLCPKGRACEQNGANNDYQTREEATYGTPCCSNTPTCTSRSIL